MKIGDRIRDCRIEKGFSQDELAKRLGYKSRSSINKIEKDASGLPQKKIAAIAEALGTTPGYIMGWEEKSTGKTDSKPKTEKLSLNIPKKKGIHKVFSFDAIAKKGLNQFRPSYVGFMKNQTARVAWTPENTTLKMKIKTPVTPPDVGEFEAELIRIYESLDVKGKLALLARAQELESELIIPIDSQSGTA